MVTYCGNKSYTGNIYYKLPTMKDSQVEHHINYEKIAINMDIICKKYKYNHRYNDTAVVE